MQARSQKPIEPGTKVLVITCPVLAHFMCLTWFCVPTMKSVYSKQYELLLDALELNTVHGIFVGRVKEQMGTRDRFGLAELQVETEGVVITNTDNELAATQNPLRQFEGEMPYLGANHVPEDFLDKMSDVLGPIYEEIIGPLPKRVTRSWTNFVTLPDDVMEALEETENPMILAAKIMNMSPEEGEAFDDRVRESGDPELVAAINMDGMVPYFQLLIARREALRPKEPVALVVPYEDGYRDFVHTATCRMLDHVSNNTRAELHRRQRFV